MDPAADPDFAALLRYHRIHVWGWTQEELAERAGLSARGVSDLERGLKRKPHRHTVEALADALALAPEDRTAFQAAARYRHAAPLSPRSGAISSLPARRPIVGRQREIQEIVTLLGRPHVRLATLTGTGGAGKTRLAIAVADRLQSRFREGVCFVPLASLSDPSLVTSAIAGALRIREVTDRSLIEALADRQMLLVLDNYEQLLPQTAPIATLIDACAGLTVLVTSRTPLRLSSEHEYLVHPFPLPDPSTLDSAAPKTLLALDAVQLFAERARVVDPAFDLSDHNAPIVARIVSALDGLPLAIELAAARSKLLSPSAILRRLDRRLALLTAAGDDVPDRHQSLRNAIAWSYDLLNVESQRLFRQVSVFVGGFTPEMAVRVWHDGTGHTSEVEMLDRIAALLDRSLLYRQDDMDEEPRFFLLPTIREYGLERAELDGEAEAIHGRHAAAFAWLTAAAEPMLTGPEQFAWFARLEAERDNVRQALAWALRHDPELALGMAGNLIRFWDHRSHVAEGQQWLAAALATPESQSSPVLGKLLWGIGTFTLVQGDYDQATAYLTEGFEAATRHDDTYHAGFILNTLGGVAADQGDLPRARMLHEEGLALLRQVGDRDGIAALLGNLGHDAVLQGNYGEAVALCGESLAIYRDLHSEHGIASMLSILGRATLLDGRRDDAARLLREGLIYAERLGDKVYAANVLHALATLAADEGQWERAARLFGMVDNLSARTSFTMSPFHQAVDERCRSTARTHMGEERYASARDEGRKMQPSEVLAFALGGSDGLAPVVDAVNETSPSSGDGGTGLPLTGRP